jgi:hypothetical protein
MTLKRKRPMRISNLAVTAFFVGFGIANGEDCGNYPYTSGLIIDDVQGGIKILSTARVVVPLDDVDAVNHARDKATHSAKVIIIGFLYENIGGDEKARTEEIERVSRLADSSYLRGIVSLGNCYTPGKEFRVSIGMKPETIAAARTQSGAQGSPETNKLGSPDQADPELLLIRVPGSATLIT